MTALRHGIKSGDGAGMGSANVATEFYEEYVPFAKKFDLLGMAEHGVLGISPKMIDPKYHTTVSLTSGTCLQQARPSMATTVARRIECNGMTARFSIRR